MNLHTLIYGLHNLKITTIIYKLNFECIRFIYENIVFFQMKIDLKLYKLISDELKN